MKAVVVGVGAMGQHHARIYHELGILAGVYDLNKEQACEVASRHGVEAYTCFGALSLAKPTIVSIATPTPLHVGQAIRCMGAGIHVLLEKPISGDLESAKKLVDYTKTSDRILAVGYIERFNPAFLDLMTFIKKGSLGQITSVNIKRVGGIPRSADNVILDLMTHDLNLLMTIFNRAPEHIYVFSHKAGPVLDSAQVLLDFGTASATCETNWISPVKIRQVHVTGTKGYFEVDLIKQQLTRFYPALPGATQRHETVEFNEEPLKNEIQAFINAVDTNITSNIVSIHDAFRTLMLTLEAAAGREA